MKLLSLLTTSIFLVVNTQTFSQTFTQKVWPEKIPGSKECPEYKERSIKLADGRVRISNVKQPQLFSYLASKEKNNGTALIILPGGGYKRLAIDHEGYDVAKWLNDNGINGFVLKYRLPNDSIMENRNVGPLMDVQEAIRIVRRNAKQWGIDPNKIGVMGFSAGGHLAASTSTLYNLKPYKPIDSTSCRPDFSLLIYGVISFDPSITHKGSRNALIGETPTIELQKQFSAELNVTDKTPPAFLVHVVNDKTVNVNNSIVYLQALKEHNIPVELHIYQSGGHGFGLGVNGSTESSWPEACLQWLKSRGF